MAHQLVFHFETGKPRTYPVAGDLISIGRHPKNTVVLDHEFVSIFHAEVSVRDGKTLIRDLQSSNGTKVNRKRVRETTLSEGDEIRFGPIVCHYRREKSPVTRTVDPKKAAPPPEKKIEPEPSLTFREKLRLHFAESRYFVISLCLHAAIVLLAGTVVLYRVVSDPADFIAEGGSGLISPTDNLAPPPEAPADTAPAEPLAPQMPNISTAKIDVITTSAPRTDFKIAPPRVEVKITPNAANLARATASISRGSTAGLANLPGTMGGRIGTGRAKLMEQNGMKPKSEQAVLNGLAWLAAYQNADGSWGDSNRGAMTGFALLCFLGHGETPASPQFGPAVKKAVDWILDNGAKNEGRLNMEKEFSQPGVYEHAISAYALGEYYTMTKDRRVTELFRQAIKYILQGQGPGGGWMYSYDHSADDLSVSGWQIQALKAAHLSQLNIPGVDPALDKAVKYIQRVKGPKGGYGYRDASDEYSLTGVGILCQLFWKGDRTSLRQGMQWLLDETETKRPVKYTGGNADLYAWYYHTQACLMFGGDAWKKWNTWFQDEICDAQGPDGSWPIPGGSAYGPQNVDSTTGAVYRTTLCILMLEVFYRYMPTTRG